MILMENRDTEMYNAVFEWLVNKFPDSKSKEIKIMLDFERATVKSSRMNFNGAKIYGCYFHFLHVRIFFSLINTFLINKAKTFELKIFKSYLF